MKEFPSTLKWITVWLLLGTLVFVGAQALLHQRQQPQLELGGGSVTLKRHSDGHFHWPAEVNGQPVDFLIDTGATRSTLPGALARDLKLPRGESVQAHTAAGEAEAWRSQVDIELMGGPQVRRWPVLVIDAMSGQPLLGMDLLSRFRLVQDGAQLKVSPPRADGTSPAG